MPTVNDFLGEIARANTSFQIVSDSRAISPGGTIRLDLISDRRSVRTMASLIIRSMHPSMSEFSNPNSYTITDITIDNAEVVRPQRNQTAASLWEQITTLLLKPVVNRMAPNQTEYRGQISHFRS